MRNKAGIPADEFADGVLAELEKGTLEIPAGPQRSGRMRRGRKEMQFWNA